MIDFIKTFLLFTRKTKNLTKGPNMGQFRLTGCYEHAFAKISSLFRLEYIDQFARSKQKNILWFNTDEVY